MQEPKAKLFALVRDKDGKPKVDGDPNKLPAQTKALLTEYEKTELGIE